MNLIMPLLIILGALGFMVGTGGTAIVAKTLGQGKPALANEYFSLLVWTGLLGGAAVGALGMVFVRPVAAALGAQQEAVVFPQEVDDGDQAAHGLAEGGGGCRPRQAQGEHRH